MSLVRAILAIGFLVSSIVALWLCLALAGAHVPADTAVGLANAYVVRFVSVCMFLVFLGCAAAAGVIISHSEHLKRFLNDR